MDSEKRKARIVKANYLLQAKVGMGPVDEKTLKRCQKIIDANEVDFAPLAKDQLNQFSAAIKEARSGETGDEKTLEDMINPVMQLKANAAMFGYDLVGALANIMLNFLETITSIDKDVLDIAEAHQKTLVMIIGGEMKGDGGPFGKELAGELREACKRYFAKQASTGNAIDDKDAFFIDG